MTAPPACQHTRNDGRDIVNGKLVCKKCGATLPFTQQPNACRHNHAFSQATPTSPRICHECGGEF
jgi:ribosomal protein L40E